MKRQCCADSLNVGEFGRYERGLGLRTALRSQLGHPIAPKSQPWNCGSGYLSRGMGLVALFIRGAFLVSSTKSLFPLTPLRGMPLDHQRVCLQKLGGGRSISLRSSNVSMARMFLYDKICEYTTSFCFQDVALASVCRCRDYHALFVGTVALPWMIGKPPLSKSVEELQY